MRSKLDGKRLKEQRRRSKVNHESNSADDSDEAAEVRERRERQRDFEIKYSESSASNAALPISSFNTSKSQLAQPSGVQSAQQRPGADPIEARQAEPSRTHSHSKDSTSTRPRTRTLEERGSENSSSSKSKGRHRVGSLKSPDAPDSDVDSKSIGFPSIVPSPKLEAQGRRQRLVKSHSRPLSPIRNPIASKSASQSASSSTDAKKILQLMKTTCGRMQGILSFRSSISSPWASGYCAINVGSGSLIYQTKGEVTLSKTLVNDLRGCQVRTLYDAETKATYLAVSTRRSTIGIHLRPHIPETFDRWLAALLCWQPIRPKGAQNKMSRVQGSDPSGRGQDHRAPPSRPGSKDAAIIKVGKMLMWDNEDQDRSNSPQPINRRISTYRPLKSMSRNWRKVSCTLQENGNFKIYAEPESRVETIVPLSHLSRYAIQRLDPSILDDEFTIAIYPQYLYGDHPSSALSSIYFSLDSRVLLEVWFVLLRAFTVPELYGPENTLLESGLGESGAQTGGSNPPTADLFRVERTLNIRIIEAKLHLPQQNPTHGSASHLEEPSRVKKLRPQGNYYAEVQFDGEIRARTVIKTDTSNPFFREDFIFSDLPPVFSNSAIELKTRNPGQKAWSLARATSDLERGDMNPGTIDGDIQVSPLDLPYGKVDIRLEGLERASDVEKWWPVVNEQDSVVGDLLMRIRMDEIVVLMGRDYAAISEILHSFSNGLTNQITQVAHVELKRLSDILLNIFQVSGHASAWLMSLVEEEIDTVHKETPMSKFRYRRRIASSDSFETNVERELFVRDLGKHATIEANLLFRGNTLLTKALDSHMRRLGKEYLEETLSEKMRDIKESDPDCEVDPHRVDSPDDLQRNWRNLIALTENLWQAIAGSANRCPPELRIIMRRIRDCAEDRYGAFLRTVAYSSVSGFLFLRFFCPAVLNPKLFGLLKDHPPPRAQRTLTLITKTLQTLANLNTFGHKEPWMEPMNVFLTNHRPGFKEFIDEICDISSQSSSSIPPSYATPITILNRLPPTSKEGFPSLPYLIDQARECASLIDVWLDARHEVDNGFEWSAELKAFDELCEGSRMKAKECLYHAEQAERPTGNLEPKWEELVEHMDRKAKFRELNGSQSSPNTLAGDGGSDSRTVDSSASSIADSYFNRNHHTTQRSRAGSRLAMAYNSKSPEMPSSDEDQTSGTESELTDDHGGSAWDSGTSPPALSTARDQEPQSETTESDEDFSELDIEHNSDILGSSIFSLTTPKSKRDSTATNKTITPSSLNKKTTPINSRWRHHLEKGPQSQYSLRRTSDKVDVSRHRLSTSGKDKRTLPPNSLYRLDSDSQPSVVDKAGNPKSPGERRDGMAGWGGSLFRKKAKDRDRERERRKDDDE